MNVPELTRALLEAIDEALDRKKGRTTEIFRKVGDELKQIGSGFYLRHRGRVFLVSAAHVFDDPPLNERWVFDGNGVLRQTAGRVFKHRYDGKRDDDLKDLIAIEIEGIVASECYDSAVVAAGTAYESALYAFVGFPGSKNGPVYNKPVFKNRSYAYYDASKRANEIASFTYDDQLNILIRYQHDKSVTNGGAAQQGPKMKGISGGPVFKIQYAREDSNWRVDLVLAGVVIHTVERYRYMAAARLSILLDVIDGTSAFQLEFETLDVAKTTAE